MRRRKCRNSAWNAWYVNLCAALIVAASGIGGVAVRAAEPANGGAAVAVNDNWPLFRGDPHSTGVSSGKLPENLELLWKHSIAGGAFESTPAIVDGVVYLGDMDGRFLALDLESGKPLWEQKFEDGFMAGAAVRDGLIYVGDIAGKFLCLDASTGKVKWAFETKAEIDSGANFYKDRVLVGSQDATLYCLQASDGKVVWKFSLPDQIRCSPTVVENRAFVAGCDSKLHVVNLDTGEEVAAVEIYPPPG